ncbi:MAG: DNA repair protein RecO [Candidatus Cloacimonetes bacterium]|nr:DNA repair protein RecO [Candidatus Cloacimonadota bacterium]
MSGAHRDLLTRAFILRKTPFKDSSFILECFSEKAGKISVIAKGIRRENNKDSGMIELLNDLEIRLTGKPESPWYILKSVNLIKSYFQEIDLNTNILMQSALETYRQLEIPREEASALYDLTIRYFDTLISTSHNGIAIFWRFLLRILRIFGIEFDLQLCVICGKSENTPAAFYPSGNGFLCSYCHQQQSGSLSIPIMPETADLLVKMKNIGNYLQEMIISPATIQEINQILFLHFSEHLHTGFHLKSLEYYRP